MSGDDIEYKNNVLYISGKKISKSFSEDETDIVFEAGKKPAVGKAYNWWNEKAKQYLPERGSHLGTRNEYVAFLGVLIKSLVTSGWPVYKAWKAVCDDSRELGNYWNSENAKNDFELTGSREICIFCDLANTHKILAWDKESDGFCLASGCCNDYSSLNPLAALYPYTKRDYCWYNSVGWLVLSK